MVCGHLASSAGESDPLLDARRRMPDTPSLWWFAAEVVRLLQAYGNPCMGTFSTLQGPVIRIPPGRYWIGDDSLPYSGPRHPLVFEKPVWIDRFPVRLSDLERVVVHGRLKPVPTASPASFREHAPHSIDGIFKTVVAATKRSFSGFEKRKHTAAALPACGLLWQEAEEVCSFFGARLPTEAEWEVAMNVGNSHAMPINSDPVGGLTSQLGCVGFPGRLQEWTRSGWTERYWTDTDVHTATPPSADMKISVRGCLPVGEVASMQCRIGVARDDGALPRLFRRVWERAPESNA